MKLSDFVHPAAKILVEYANLQDAAWYDGSTSVVLLAFELLKQLKPIVKEADKISKLLYVKRYSYVRQKLIIWLFHIRKSVAIKRNSVNC